MPTITTLIKFIFLWVTLLYLALCASAYFLQSSLIFYPSTQVNQLPLDLNVEEVFFTTDNGFILHWYWIDNDSDKTVLFSHWNAWNISHRASQIQVFNELKVNALMYDYRGYGKSEWTIKKEKDLHQDAEAAYTVLIDTYEVDQANIILWWRSLWWAVTSHLAAWKDVHWVIIESSFTSIVAMWKRVFRFLPIKLLAKFPLDSEKKMKNIESKILIIHSPSDEVIPYEEGKILFEAANDPKTFLEIQWSHNNWYRQSSDLYIKELRVFIYE